MFSFHSPYFLTITSILNHIQHHFMEQLNVEINTEFMPNFPAIILGLFFYLAILRTPFHASGSGK